jgi:hypothetical protein
MGDGLAEPNKPGGGVAALVACLMLAALATCLAPAGPMNARAEGTSNQGSGDQGGAPAAAAAQPTPQSPSGAVPATPPPPAAAPAIPAQPQAVNRPGFLHQLKGWWDDSLTLFDSKSSGAKSLDAKSFDAKSLDAKSRDAHNTGGEADQKPGDGNAAAGAAQSAATATQGAMKSAVEATKGAASTATDAMKGAMEATKNAATVIVRLPNTRVVELHETCLRAPNGGADCATAAANGCRAKGFAGGTPLDTRTGAACDTKQPDARQLQAGQTPAVRCAAEAVVTRAVCQ